MKRLKPWLLGIGLCAAFGISACGSDDSDDSDDDAADEGGNDDDDSDDDGDDESGDPPEDDDDPPEDDDDPPPEDDGEEECLTSHSCLNGVCQCTTPGVDGMPCTDDDACVAECEVCS